MKQIEFNQNWNNKLSCSAHTTLRLHNDSKYVTGERYEELLNGKKLQEVTLIAKRVLWLHELNDYVCYLDTGLDTVECKKVLKAMYPNVDFNQQKLDFILLVVDKSSIAAVNEKVAAFCRLHDEILKFKYRITQAEIGKIKSIDITDELLEFYFKSTDFKLKEKSVSNLVKYYNYLRQLIMQPELPVNSIFPDSYSSQFASKLTGKQVSEYYAHLRSKGLIAKTDRLGNVIDFVKQ